MDKRASLRIRVRPEFKDQISRAADAHQESINKYVNRVLRKDVQKTLSEMTFQVQFQVTHDGLAYVIFSQLDGNEPTINHVGVLPRGSTVDAAIKTLQKKHALPSLIQFKERDRSKDDDE
jgi:hypothetical protein